MKKKQLCSLRVLLICCWCAVMAAPPVVAAPATPATTGNVTQGKNSFESRLDAFSKALEKDATRREAQEKQQNQKQQTMPTPTSPGTPTATAPPPKAPVITPPTITPPTAPKVPAPSVPDVAVPEVPVVQIPIVGANATAQEKAHSAEESQQRITAVVYPALSHTVLCPMNATVQTVYVREGDMVNHGQVLVRLLASKADIETELAKNTLFRLEKDLDALAPLYPEAANLWKAQQVVIRDTLHQLESGQTAHLALAPSGGKIIVNAARVGQSCAAGATLLEIADMSSPMQAECVVPSKYLQWLKKGGLLDIHITETDQVYEAVITNIGATVDAATKTIKVQATLKDAPEGLLPGMSGYARIVLSGT